MQNNYKLCIDSKGCLCSVLCNEYIPYYLTDQHGNLFGLNVLEYRYPEFIFVTKTKYKNIGIVLKAENTHDDYFVINIITDEDNNATIFTKQIRK